MICHGFKGGIGTSSRKVMIDSAEYTLGVLVQANYGTLESLTVAGVPVGKEISDLMPELGSLQKDEDSGSIIVIVATDAPLLPHQLKRIARRVPIGISRMGGYGGNSSGDIFIAFSVANPGAANREEDQNVKFIMAELIKSSPAIEICATWFISKNTGKIVLFQDISNPENATLEWKFEFKSPDMIV